MIRLRLALPLLPVLLAPMLHAQNWIAPTPEELKMTSIPEVPGADAVILNRDEADDDDNHVRNIYYRIKILTEAGVKRGDVELEFDKRHDLRGNSIGEIYARTIEPDGSIVPFTGKPYDKVLEKDKDNSFSARVFSLPAVKVGSIIEYRYTIRWDDYIFFSPDWVIQTDLFLRKGHFMWKPTDKELHGVRRGGRESYSERLTWAKSLPPGVDVVNTHLPTGRIKLEVNVADVAPFGNEEYMPPLTSARYHVFFYYSPYYSGKDYWDTEIKYWNSDTGKFASTSGFVRSEATEAIAGAATDEAKARKLYAYVMKLDNTDYSRKRTTQEEKAEIKSAEDVLKRKHGSADEIAMTYVAMARSVGLDAAVMQVADRTQRIFDLSWQEINQLNDSIVVVKLGGVDHFLDPGSRYSTFDHLEWGHTMTAAIRQDNKDATKQFQLTPGETYKYSHTTRIGDVKLEADGHMTGTVTLTYEGSPALRWRHVALRNDEAELRVRFRKDLESWMPGGTEVQIKSITGVEDGEVPLKVTAAVDGHVGSSVGSRVLVPSDLFEANSRPTFPHEKREQGVYFPYSEMIQDAVRYTLPAGYAIDSVPEAKTVQMQNLAAYSLKSTVTANTVTLRRDFVMGDVYFPQKDYGELRTFYNNFQHQDHSSVVLKRTTTTATQ